MRYLSLFTLVSMLAIAPARGADITEYIKHAAAQHPDSVETDATRTTYSIYAFRPPRGYRAIITYAESTTAPPTLSLTLFEAVRRGRQLTVLVDDEADGTVDYTLTSRGPDIAAADAAMRQGHAKRSKASADEQRIYADLRAQLQAAAKREELTSARLEH